MPELGGEFLQVDAPQKLLHRLGSHEGPEQLAVLLPIVPVLRLGQKLLLGKRRITGVSNYIGSEVYYLLERPGGHVQQKAHPRRDALQVPDVRDRRRQLYVAHALAPDLRLGDLDAALVAHDALVANALVLAAVALPVTTGAEDPLAEEPVALGFQATVVDGLRLFHFTTGPRPYLFRGCYSYPDLLEIVDV